MKAPALAATTLLATVTWTIALIVESGPFSPSQVLVLGAGILSCSVVGLVGMVVPGGRWARRLSFASIAATIPLALVRPLDLLWLVGLVSSVGAASLLFHPAVTARVRKLPAAAGPPARAVVLPLLLLGAPYLIGLVATGDRDWALLLVALSAPLAAFAYSRVIPGGLWGVRILWPALALGMAPLLGWAAGVVSVTLAVSTGWLAWDPSVKTAYHPPREMGSTLPIPPELTPPEILDAAQLDDEGRRRGAPE